MDEDKHALKGPELPEDLLFAEILSKLQAKSLMSFKCVSKSWLTRISSDSSFITDHLSHHSNTNLKHSIFLRSYEDYNPVFGQTLSLLSDTGSTAIEDIDMSYIVQTSACIVGSCNGLVCLRVRNAGKHIIDQLVLWNPATRKLRYVDDSSPSNLWPGEAGSGFGFDQASNDYKVVILVSNSWLVLSGLRNPNARLLTAQVFSKRSGFRRNDSDSAVSGLCDTCLGAPVTANGALHWSVYKINEDQNRVNHVLSFDLHDEVLRVGDAPSHGVGLKLCKWKESLAALVSSSEVECCLWTTSDGESGFGWRKMFRVDVAMGLVREFRGVWRDQFLFQIPCELLGYMKLGLLEPTAGEVRKLEAPWPCFVFFHAHDYFESLVSVF